jgi:hypothetical protein
MKSLQNRIFDKCEPVPESGCWLWTGATFNHGRGQLRIGDRLVLASRASYEAFHGEAPGDLLVCHKCDTPACVNPDHLFLGTHQDNKDDCVAKNRQARNRGEKGGRAVLTERDVRKIRATYARGGIGSEALGREYGVSGRQIRYIVNRQEWAHIA